MRTATYKRLLGILEADIAKLEAKRDHDRFGDWEKATQAASDKFKEAMQATKPVQHAKLLVEHEQLEKKAAKLWKVVQAGHRDWPKWDEELRALRGDLYALQYAFSFQIR